MKTKDQNPFRPTRWEHHREGQQLIWYTPTANELIGEKSTFVYGSRGSGKTTLLRGICWEDLSFNKSLRIQKRLADFDHIGIYIRFPDHISASFPEKVWSNSLSKTQNPEFEFHRVFSLLIEITCVERLLESAHELRILNDLHYSPSAELELVGEIVNEHPKLTNFGSGKPTTFTDLSRCLRSMAREINQAFGRGQIEPLWERLPPREPYELLHFVCEKLSRMVVMHSKLSPRSPRFKFCFDDCEVLDHFQRKSLNSLVRQSRSPISWVVASVGKSQWSGDTFINSQPLTDADRTIISLDRRESSDFSRLCEAVASMRLFFSLPESKQPSLDVLDIDKFFDLDKRLGRASINSMIAKMILKSSKTIAKDVTLAAETLRAEQQKIEGGKKQISELPYYEAYTLLHWQGGDSSFRAQYDKSQVNTISNYAQRLSDQNFSAWLRRKQVNALLQLSAKLSQKRIPISGAHYVVSLSDGSIRDFLEILADIFDEAILNGKDAFDYPTALLKFANSRFKIADDVQTRGIYSASESYFEGISNRFDVDGDLLTRLISGLAYLTSFLQSNPSDPRVLAFAERGIFLFSLPKERQTDSGMVEDAKRALKQAELAGYLRPIQTSRLPRRVSTRTDSLVLAYRLHKRFSPAFRFSFRGAYEPFRVELTELYELCVNSERGASLRWAEKMSGISDRFDDDQFILPLVDDNYNE